MALLGEKPVSLSDLTNKIRNPFNEDVNRPFRGADFTDGFLIEELTGPKRVVRLVGNQMPKIPFNFGGEQRIKEDYYAGHSEPVTQILGPKESDTVITGTLKDKKYKDTKFNGVATEIQELIDSIRIRGNLCLFKLGEWRRYGYIKATDFNMSRLNFVEYSITLYISGFNAPTNARFLQKQRLIPFAINSLLIAEAAKFEKGRSSIPKSVPQSISDIMNSNISAIAEEITKLTNLVDQIIETAGDVQKSLNRILGLISTVQNKARSYSNFLGGVDSFGSGSQINTPLTAQYTSSDYFSSSISSMTALSALLNKYRDQFKAVFDNSPLGRHVVKQGDNLQKISNKFYGTSDNWKDILEYNELLETELVIGTILEIPRL